jgi:hypothetical protein
VRTSCPTTPPLHALPDAQLLVRVHNDARGECDTLHTGLWPRRAALRIRGRGGKCGSGLIGREQLSESSMRKPTYRGPQREYVIELRTHRRRVSCRRARVSRGCCSQAVEQEILRQPREREYRVRAGREPRRAY